MLYNGRQGMRFGKIDIGKMDKILKWFNGDKNVKWIFQELFMGYEEWLRESRELLNENYYLLQGLRYDL